MNEKALKLLGVNWVGRAIRSGSKADVTVSIVHNNDTDEKVSITIRNEVDKLISTTGYIKVGIIKNRILFVESNDFEGLTLCINNGSKTENKYVRFGDKETVNLFRAFSGNYTLKYDNDYDVYYIEREEE